jgi:hypothetical protein
MTTPGLFLAAPICFILAKKKKKKDKNCTIVSRGARFIVFNIFLFENIYFKFFFDINILKQ